MSGIYVGTADGVKELQLAGGPNKVHGEQIFTSSGTFTVPEGVTKIDVFLVGGGSSISVRSGSAAVTNGRAWITFAVAGCAKTIFGIPVNAAESHQVLIGTGGKYITNNGVDIVTTHDYNYEYWWVQPVHPGGDTKFDDYVAKGGGNVLVGDNSGSHSLYADNKSSINEYIITGSRCTNVECYALDNFERETVSVHPYMLFSDTIHSFGNKNGAEYCKLDASTAGSCGTVNRGQSIDDGIDDGLYLNVSNASGKDGICIIRW